MIVIKPIVSYDILIEMGREIKNKSKTHFNA